MKNPTLSLATLSSVLVFSLLLATAPTAADCDRLAGCTLVWSDEFDGSEVDLSKWSFQTGDGTDVGLPPGWGNNELQYYRPENATVDGGFLTITAKEEPFGGYLFTSARMRSLGKGDWTYGRMEMRARMPIGKGLWPAFWMLPSDSVYGGWAASGEIDIVEYVGHIPYRILGTIHYGGPWPYNQYSTSNYYLPAGTFHDDFHVFAVEWEYGQIRWYVDDVHYATRTYWYSTGAPFPAPFDQEFHLLLNVAVGGNLPGSPNSSTEFPQELVVDYVRVYQAPPTIEIIAPAPGDAIEPGDDLTVVADVNEAATIQRVEFLQDKVVLGEATAPPYEWTVYGVAAGCYTLRARAWADTGVPSTSPPVDARVGSGCPQAPYRMAPTAIPGTVEAEDFDIGGPGVAYEDSDAGNNGGAYRSGEAVDLESTSDTGGGFNVGWTAPAEWIEYGIDVTAGTYDIELRVASLSSGGTLHLEFDGVDRTGPVTFGATGGWQEWITVRIEDVTLSGGIQTLRVVQDTDGFNLNWIRIVPPPDGDADGVPDREDLCVVSDLSPTVVIDGCDSGTPNLLGGDGCTFSDDIAGAAAAAPNHGQFVSAVTRLMNRARRARLIRGDQGGAVVSCAARSDLPHRMSPRPQEILPTLSVAPSAPGRQGNGNRGSRGNRSPG